MTNVNLAIVGSRNFTDREEFGIRLYDALHEWGLELSGSSESMLTIVSGGASGADTLAEEFALEKGIPFEKYLPDWNKYGKAAGPIRNKLIIDNATHVLAFPSNSSVGSIHSMELARKQKLKMIVVWV